MTPTTTPPSTTSNLTSSAVGDTPPQAVDLRQQLEALAASSGVSLQQLLAVAVRAETVTVSAYVERVKSTQTPGCRKTYLPYLLRLSSDPVGDLDIAAATVTDLDGFVTRSTTLAQATRGERRNARGGRSAHENSVDALRWLFTRACLDKLRDDNPALGPPYRPRLLRLFLARAVATASQGTPVVALVPAATSTQWWAQHVTGSGGRVNFLTGRLRFGGPPSTGGPAPLASALVQWTET